MLLTNHVLTGGLIGLKIQNPALVGVTGFSSHLILDSLPHTGGSDWFDFKRPTGRTFAVADCAVALTAYVVMLHNFPHQWLPITIGVFFAALPDLAYVPRELFGIIIGKRFMKFHSLIQWGERPWGLLIDAGWMVFTISLLQQVRP